MTLGLIISNLIGKDKGETGDGSSKRPNHHAVGQESAV